MFHFGSGDFSQDPSTLNFKQDGPIFGSHNQSAGSTPIKNGIDIGNGGLDALGGFIVHVLDGNLSLMTIEDGKTIASQKDAGSQTSPAFAIGHTATAVGQTKGNQFVGTTVDVTRDQDIAFAGIVLIVRQLTGSTANPIGLGLLSHPP